MNTTDFITPGDFESVKQALTDRKDITYRKKIKVGKNSYELTISVRNGFDFKGGDKYFMHRQFDYNCNEGVGGYGHPLTIDELGNYEQFKEQFNRYLSHFKDYDEQEQFTLF